MNTGNDSTSTVVSVKNKKQWDTVVFTNEIAFLLHLPHWINPTHQKLIYLVSRCLIHAIAIPLLIWDSINEPFSWKALESIFNGPHATAGWSLMAVSFIIYIISYLHHTLFTPPEHRKFNPNLFALAHISIINFILDRPVSHPRHPRHPLPHPQIPPTNPNILHQGHNISTVNITRPIIKISQFIVGIVVAFIIITIVPLQNAWGCYDPAFISSIKDYNLGTCPTDHTAHHEICTNYPIIKCDTDFTPSIFNDTIHYTSQILAVVVIIYLLETYDEITYFKLFSQ